MLFRICLESKHSNVHGNAVQIVCNTIEVSQELDDIGMKTNYFR